MSCVCVSLALRVLTAYMLLCIYTNTHKHAQGGVKFRDHLQVSLRAAGGEGGVGSRTEADTARGSSTPPTLPKLKSDLTGRGGCGVGASGLVSGSSYSRGLSEAVKVKRLRADLRKGLTGKGMTGLARVKRVKASKQMQEKCSGAQKLRITEKGHKEGAGRGVGKVKGGKRQKIAHIQVYAGTGQMCKGGSEKRVNRFACVLPVCVCVCVCAWYACVMSVCVCVCSPPTLLFLRV